MTSDEVLRTYVFAILTIKPARRGVSQTWHHDYDDVRQQLGYERLHHRYTEGQKSAWRKSSF